MSTKADYDTEEWNSISAAPVAAGLMIILSEARGPVGVANVMTVGTAITQSARGDAPDFVKALAETVARLAGCPELPEMPFGDRRRTKHLLIATISKAVRAVQRKAPTEVEAYKAWLAGVAAKVSRASKQSGLPGYEAPLSTDEKEALEQLTRVLAVGAIAERCECEELMLDAGDVAVFTAPRSHDHSTHRLRRDVAAASA